MSNASLMKFGEASAMNGRAARHILSVGHLVYLTSLQRVGAPIIPLGTIAEVNVPRLRGFGLLCRSRLRPDELNLMGGMSAKLLSEPSKYWSDRARKIFQRMDEEQELRGHLIEILGGDGVSSIAVINTARKEIPTAWITKEHIEIKAEVSEYLQKVTDSEMTKLEEACGNEPAPDNYTMDIAA